MQCTGGKHDGVTAGDVLAFFTGASQIPPLGFEADCVLNFSETGCYPTASTCGLVLTLPIQCQDFDSFQSKFLYAIKNHGGFGLE